MNNLNHWELLETPPELLNSVVWLVNSLGKQLVDSGMARNSFGSNLTEFITYNDELVTLTSCRGGFCHFGHDFLVTISLIQLLNRKT